MPDNITNDANDAVTDDQAPAADQTDGTDTDTDSSDGEEAKRPTPNDVAKNAERKPEEDSDGSLDEDADDLDDEDDTDDTEDDSEQSEELKKLLRKNRRTNRENKNLRERNSAIERELNQLKVALQTGLPPEMASRLQGKTVEEMTQDAESILPLISKKNPFVPGAFPDDGVRRGDARANSPESATDLNQIGARIYER